MILYYTWKKIAMLLSSTKEWHLPFGLHFPFILGWFLAIYRRFLASLPLDASNQKQAKSLIMRIKSRLRICRIIYWFLVRSSVSHFRLLSSTNSYITRGFMCLFSFLIVFGVVLPPQITLSARSPVVWSEISIVFCSIRVLPHLRRLTWRNIENRWQIITS